MYFVLFRHFICGGRRRHSLKRPRYVLLHQIQPDLLNAVLVLHSTCKTHSSIKFQKHNYYKFAIYAFVHLCITLLAQALIGEFHFIITYGWLCAKCKQMQMLCNWWLCGRHTRAENTHTHTDADAMHGRSSIALIDHVRCLLLVGGSWVR